MPWHTLHHISLPPVPLHHLNKAHFRLALRLPLVSPRGTLASPTLSNARSVYKPLARVPAPSEGATLSPLQLSVLSLSHVPFHTNKKAW